RRLGGAVRRGGGRTSGGGRGGGDRHPCGPRDRGAAAGRDALPRPAAHGPRARGHGRLRSRLVIALLSRDLRLAVRAGGGFGLGLAFFLIVAVLVPLGVGPETAVLGTIAPGVLWVGALLSALLSLDRMFALDHEDGSLDLLATSALPLE